MHIPDGFLSGATMATTAVASAAGLGVAVKMVSRRIGERHVPLMGMMGAFIFAAQMLNFPVVGGASGHLIGAALAAILLGPWASIIIMSLVLIAQCLIFQDGGLLALGANIFNMSIIAGLGAYLIYRLLTKFLGEDRRLVAGFVAAWFSVVIASVAAALELAISGTVPLDAVLPAMVGWHTLIGIGEGLITIAMLGLVRAVRKDLLQMGRA
ncbi:MAG: energy-coupling factor ABC transporter permease [Dehalococcoidia bacterium]|nr:energy-coupling factor ABC transporter permease [Dehalococcoidia bacterium]